MELALRKSVTNGGSFIFQVASNIDFDFFQSILLKGFCLRKMMPNFQADESTDPPTKSRSCNQYATEEVRVVITSSPVAHTNMSVNSCVRRRERTAEECVTESSPLFTQPNCILPAIIANDMNKFH